MRVFGYELSLKRSAPRDPALAMLLDLPSNTSGASVTPENAMRSTAVYACVRVLSETMGVLPLQMFRRKKDGSKEKAISHPLYRLVHQSPNGWQAAAEFREQVTMHAALKGAGYARIIVRPDGKRQLIPLNPDNVRATLADDGKIVYELTVKAKREILLQGEVLRVPYYVRDGVEPISPVRLHAESVGQNITSKTYTNTFLRNGGRPPGYIKFDVPFKDQENRKRFKDQLQSELGGQNRGTTLILEQGEYKAIGISNEDAQLIEICKLSLLDVCRIYRVPPHMVGDLERATWKNVEQQSIDFVVHTIGPWLVRWEQALARDLLTEKEQDEYLFEFNVNGLLRGDVKTRYAAYAQGRQWGWLSINDIRDLENLNRIEDGDTYLSPMNMIPTWQVGQNEDGKTQP